MEILKLILKKKWFDMILSGEKNMSTERLKHIGTRDYRF